MKYSSLFSGLATLFVIAFSSLVTGSALAGKFHLLFLWLYLVASITAFAAYAFDKSAAINGGWRTQESTLHLLALSGGWPGALAAQRVLRHKSRKKSFQMIFWTTIALNCGVIFWLLYDLIAEKFRLFIESASEILPF